MEPVWVGLCSGLQPKMLDRRSQALLSALKTSQGLWFHQPSQTYQLQKALQQLVKQGLLVVQELQEQLVQRGWQVGAHGHPPQGQARPKPRPLQRFLLEEAGSFLAMLKQVGRDLACAQERLQGVPCCSPRCIAILRDLERERLPRHWLPYAPTGPEHLQEWLHTLQRRCELLGCYLESIGGPPVVCYQLAAFQQPQRLFLALLQEKARAEKQELDSYQLDQQVRAASVGKGHWAWALGSDAPLVLQVLPSVLPPSSAPEKGLYLSGLELYHAMWNAQSSQLQETLSAQPCQLPPVWVQASREPWKAASALSKYQCPVYLGSPQALLCLRSQGVVMHLALPSKMSPDVCTQHRVHAVSVLR